ncbi:MAG: fatty acyl-AMP ligase [Myxococcota bacterium]
MPSPKATLVEAMRALPSTPGRGFRFLGLDRVERAFTYEALTEEAERRAAHLQARGVRKGDRVALVIAEPHEFVLTFLGVVTAGAVPVPIYPRAGFKNLDAYVEVLAHVARVSGASLACCLPGNREVVLRAQEASPTIREVLEVPAAFEGTPPPFVTPDLGADDLCFLQFTSGSTSKPKGVRVSHGNLVANASAFLGPHGLDRNDDDVGVSWLPLFHDMGLIGFVLGTLIMDIPVVLLPTESFARSPRLWVEQMTKHRATITFAPNFAYQLVTRRVKERHMAALDLSALRVAGSGAEPIRAKTLEAFATHFEPAGFDRKAFLPCYGMAESTLAITFHTLGSPMRVDRVDPAALREGRAEASSADDATEIVGCGKPFPDHGLRIVAEDGTDLGEREVGEVWVRGPSVTAGYYERLDATAEAFAEGGWLKTGDLAYRAEEDLFICGRAKDLIIVRGANHHPQDIEWTVGDLEGVRRGNVYAFSVLRDGTEELVVAAEAHSDDAARLREEIAKEVAAKLGLAPGHVAIVPIGSLPKTSSGKAQRRKTKALYEAGELVEHP